MSVSIKLEDGDLAIVYRSNKDKHEIFIPTKHFLSSKDTEFIKSYTVFPVNKSKSKFKCIKDIFEDLIKSHIKEV